MGKNADGLTVAVRKSYYDEGWKDGVRDAAAFADEYNRSTTHPFRLGDCIAGKFNVRKGNPRKNKHKIQTPEHALTQGMAVALAEMHRACGDSSAVCQVARAAGITIEVAKEAGTDGYDWKELVRAGVPRR
jgi:hypothetical protein